MGAFSLEGPAHVRAFGGVVFCRSMGFRALPPLTCVTHALPDVFVAAVGCLWSGKRGGASLDTISFGYLGYTFWTLLRGVNDVNPEGSRYLCADRVGCGRGGY